MSSNAPGDPAGGVLVVGFGNALRADDGVGWHAAAALADDPRLVGVAVLALHQLMPELALDMSRASLVIIVDASTDQDAGAIVVRRLTAEPRAGGGEAQGGPGGGPRTGRVVGATSHHVGPGELLAVAHELFGAAPETFTVSVGVADMEAGESLSPAVAAALPGVADAVVDLIAAHRRSRGMRRPA